MLGLKIVAAKAATAVMLATPLYTKVCTHIIDFFIALYACKHIISWTQLQSNYTWRKQKKGVANP